MGSIIKVNEYKDFNNNDIITSDGAGNVTLSSGMQTAVQSAGATNTPAFLAFNGSAQTLSHNTSTKIVFDLEKFDTDSAFASNTFTVPSGISNS